MGCRLKDTYLRTVDFAHSLDLSEDGVIQATPLPSAVPIYRHGGFWADEESLYVTEGFAESYPYVSPDGTFPGRPTLRTGSTVWHYNIVGNTWETPSDHQSDDEFAVNNAVSNFAFAWNQNQRTSYMFGGDGDPGRYRRYPGEALKTLPGFTGGRFNQLLSFGNENATWSNRTTDLTPQHWSLLNSFSNVGSAGKEILIMLGGQYTGSGVCVMVLGMIEVSVLTLLFIDGPANYSISVRCSD